jgi:hypothetical protein
MSQSNSRACKIEDKSVDVNSFLRVIFHTPRGRRVRSFMLSDLHSRQRSISLSDFYGTVTEGRLI